MGIKTLIGSGLVVGQMIVIDVNGNVRVLKEGEAPLPGEVLVTPNGEDGQLNPNVEIVLEDEQLQDITGEIGDIIAALEEGEDPTQLGEEFATAAGGQTGSSPTATPTLERDGDETIASTAFSTAGFQSLGLSETQSLTLLDQYRFAQVEPLFVDASAVDIGEVLSLSTEEDNALTGQLLAEDDNNDPLTFTAIAQPENGTVDLSREGSWTYTPNENYNGPDSFTVQVSDGQGGTDTLVINIDVTPVNDAPVFVDLNNNDAGDGTNVVTKEDDPVSGKVQAIDIDGDALTYSVSGQPENGAVTVDADGNWTYIPAQEYNGSDSFELTVSDGQGGTDTFTVDVTVLPVAEMTVTAGQPVVEDDNSYLEFTISLDQAVTEDVTLDLTLGDESDTATKSVDYLENLFVSDGEGGYRPITEDDLTIASGETELRVFVQIIDDVETEETESITLIASSESEFVEEPTAQDTGEVTDDRGT
ncbi:tandem-95 repeat protein, partial [Vibrio mexicanus]|uniref:tandem-95 repeat protein n=1 Tax=Vibrio mexicanus TaxID=1004326 RepID=UPI00063C4B7A